MTDLVLLTEAAADHKAGAPRARCEPAWCLRWHVPAGPRIRAVARTSAGQVIHIGECFGVSRPDRAVVPLFLRGIGVGIATSTGMAEILEILRVA